MADFKLTDTNDYEVINGDFALTANQLELDLQNTQLILEIDLGGMKSNPLGGVGMGKRFNDKLTEKLESKIKSELQKDNISVSSVTQEGLDIIVKIRKQNE